MLFQKCQDVSIIISRHFTCKKLKKIIYIFIIYYYCIVLIIINFENGIKNTNPITNIVVYVCE